MLKRDVQIVSGGGQDKTVILPKVFKWHSKDFGDDKGVMLNFVAEYVPAPLSTELRTIALTVVTKSVPPSPPPPLPHVPASHAQPWPRERHGQSSEQSLPRGRAQKRPLFRSAGVLQDHRVRAARHLIRCRATRGLPATTTSRASPLTLVSAASRASHCSALTLPLSRAAIAGTSRSSS